MCNQWLYQINHSPFSAPQFLYNKPALGNYSWPNNMWLGSAAPSTPLPCSSDLDRSDWSSPAKRKLTSRKNLGSLGFHFLFDIQVTSLGKRRPGLLWHYQAPEWLRYFTSLRGCTAKFHIIKACKVEKKSWFQIRYGKPVSSWPYVNVLTQPT